MLGFITDETFGNKGDTVEVYAYLYGRDEEPVPQANLIGVNFTVQYPDGIEAGQVGEITDDGTGYIRWTDTTQIGHYPVLAQFQLYDGALQSVRADFEVIDPFDPPAPDVAEIVGDAVWNKVEDCFDAEAGGIEGPWLREQTLNHFSRSKMPTFISQAMFSINYHNPPTNFTEDLFVVNGNPTGDFDLLVQGTFLPVIRHLMRSYAEQPDPQGAQISWHSRRDYLDRWAAVYKTETDVFKEWLALWKRQFLGLGRSKILVDSKAGRLTPAPLRTRFVGRGYYLHLLVEEPEIGM